MSLLQAVMAGRQASLSNRNSNRQYELEKRRLDLEEARYGQAVTDSDRNFLISESANQRAGAADTRAETLFGERAKNEFIVRNPYLTQGEVGRGGLAVPGERETIGRAGPETPSGPLSAMNPAYLRMGNSEQYSEMMDSMTQARESSLTAAGTRKVQGAQLDQIGRANAESDRIATERDEAKRRYFGLQDNVAKRPSASPLELMFSNEPRGKFEQGNVDQNIAKVQSYIDSFNSDLNGVDMNKDGVLSDNERFTPEEMNDQGYQQQFRALSGKRGLMKVRDLLAPMDEEGKDNQFIPREQQQQILSQLDQIAFRMGLNAFDVDSNGAVRQLLQFSRSPIAPTQGEQ